MLAIDFSLKNNQKHIGAGYINEDKRIMQIVEFEDNDYFSQLESLVIQLNSQETDEKNFQILINMPNDDSYSSRIGEIFNQCDVEFTISNRVDFVTKDVADMLDSLLVQSFKYYEEEATKELALGALRCAITFSNIHSIGANHGKYSLSVYSMNNYLRLDVAALTALNIFPQNTGGVNQLNNQDSTSIYELINQ